MINILVGLPGAGKTYVLTRKAIEFVKAGLDIYPYYAYQLTGKEFEPYKKQIHYWETTEDLINLEQGVILLDEAQVWFNSRTWQDLDIRLQYKLQQHRKDGLDIWGSVQHESRLDPVMRQLITHYYMCNKIISSRENAKKVWGIIRVSVYYPEDIGKAQRVPAYGEWFLIRRRFVDAYNTNAKIKVEERERPLKHIVHKCLKKGCDFTRITHR